MLVPDFDVHRRLGPVSGTREGKPVYERRHDTTIRGMTEKRPSLIRPRAISCINGAEMIQSCEYKYIRDRLKNEILTK